MTREPRLTIDAEITLRHRETGEEENLTVHGIEAIWQWDDLTRDAAEYWAVVDWIGQTFGNRIDWFSITSCTGSPKTLPTLPKKGK
jgi:hypothetical protein